MRFSDKVAVITGGSRGIGFAVVEAFLREGATVILTASRQDSADKAVAKIKEKDPEAKITGIAPNLRDMNEMKAAYAKIIEQFGHVDVLVNNAGISDMTAFTDYTPEQFQKVMDLNVSGIFNSTNAMVPYMIENGGGAIVNTSSMVSFYGQPSGVAYPMSKYAVNGMTVSLARELGPKGIRVNAVAPGITETDMMKAVPATIINPMIQQIPLRRLGQPSDIANAVVFLASEEASYITGVVLRVDGMARS